MRHRIQRGIGVSPMRMPLKRRVHGRDAHATNRAALVALLLGILMALTTPRAARAAQPTTATAFRPPAVPLVTCDPYFSVWSMADRLTDDVTRHWTGKPHALSSAIRVDGKTFRVIGDRPKDVPAMTQTLVQVLPTRTIYTFESDEVALTLTFTTPLLCDDLDLLARPVTYVTWDVRARDGRERDVEVSFSASSDLAVNEPKEPLVTSRLDPNGLVALRVGTKEQPVLRKKGDDVRINWGYLYLAAPADQAKGSIEANDAPTVTMPLGAVGASVVSRHVILAYDDEYSIQYFEHKLRPYWRRNGMDAAALLRASENEYESIRQRCRAFDEDLMADLRRAGGEKFAQIGALAYRQSIAANKLAASPEGQPLFFPKENFSNGCIATVDVIYPMLPQYLLFSPELAKASLVPVLDYAQSPRWKFDFAPHDLGTYPHATGQVYGGGEKTEENQMPVEESGNMLILLAAIAQADGNAEFAGKYWPLVQRWARFLRDKGFDPERQLCTDDFAGHLAHNVNLSAKAIVALGCYAMLCDMRGDQAEASEYRKLAQDLAARWLKEANDGDHYRLAFDKPGTWSQKYNLVWDRVLGLDLFPKEAIRKEMDFYRRTQQKYGLPLDNRKTWTKLDWIIWTATLTGSRDDFDALVEPVWRFLHETPDRVPMTDWYHADTARVAGFRARPVVGAVFMPLLADRDVWRKWSTRAKQ